MHFRSLVILCIFLISTSGFAQEQLSNNSLLGELTFTQSKYDISGAVPSQKISTEYTSRFKFTYSRRLSERYVLFTSLTTYRVVVNDALTKTSKDSEMGAIEIGTRYFINPKWTAVGSMEFKRELFFTKNGNAISGDPLWSKRINVAGFYKAFERERYNIIPSLKAALILGGGVKEMGTSYMLNTNFNYYFQSIRLSTAIGYESRTQEASAIKVTEQGLLFNIGLGYSF